MHIIKDKKSKENIKIYNYILLRYYTVENNCRICVWNLRRHQRFENNIMNITHINHISGLNKTQEGKNEL